MTGKMMSSRLTPELSILTQRPFTRAPSEHLRQLIVELTCSQVAQLAPATYEQSKQDSFMSILRSVQERQDELVSL